MPTSRRGFTLVELLVVISIISILAVIGAVIFTELQKKGRDAKRQSDLAVIQSALEHYHSDQGYYPDGFGTVKERLETPLTTGSKIYLKKLPQDPKDPDIFYKYQYQGFPRVDAGGAYNCDNTTNNGPCTIYCLYANLENDSAANTGTVGCPADWAGSDYEVRSP